MFGVEHGEWLWSGLHAVAGCCCWADVYGLPLGEAFAPRAVPGWILGWGGPWLAGHPTAVTLSPPLLAAAAFLGLGLRV